MSKQNKKGCKKAESEKVLLATAILSLIKIILEIIKTLLE